MTHLLIDGYNVIRRIDRFLEAEREGLRAGREALLMELEAYGAATGLAITVVFDGGGRPAGDDSLEGRERFAGVDVVYSGRGRSADFEIHLMLMEHARERTKDPHDLVLITDDFGLRDEAMGLGAFVSSPARLDEAMRSGGKLPY